MLDRICEYFCGMLGQKFSRGMCMSVQLDPSGYHFSPHSHLANIHGRKNFIFFGGFCNTSNYGEAHTFHIGVLLWACVLKENRKHRRVFG